MIPAIADRSTMPLWPWWIWALLLAAALAFAGIILWALVVEDRALAERSRGIVVLPSSGRPVPRCWTHACPYPGVVPVFDRHAGVELEVCVGCAHDGVARGYYRLLPKRAA